MSRCHWWSFTLNNPTPEEKAKIEQWVSKEMCTYVKYQEEQGAEGTRHYQGCCRFTNQVRMSSCRLLLSRAHWEAVKHVAKMLNYCGKVDSRVAGPFEFGANVIHQGKRTDLEDVKQAIDDGATYDELCESYFGTVAKCAKFVQERVLHKAKKRDYKTKVIVISGAPGCGKTWTVHKTVERLKENLYMVPISSSGTYFPDYNGTDPVLLDDYNGNIVGAQFLRMLDRYACTGDVKGSHVNFAPNYLFITSNFEPDTWYDVNKVNPEAVLRRIDIWIEMKKIPVKDPKTGYYGSWIEVSCNTGVDAHFKPALPSMVCTDVPSAVQHACSFLDLHVGLIEDQMLGGGDEEITISKSTKALRDYRHVEKRVRVSVGPTSIHEDTDECSGEAESDQT